MGLNGSLEAFSGDTALSFQPRAEECIYSKEGHNDCKVQEVGMGLEDLKKTKMNASEALGGRERMGAPS